MRQISAIVLAAGEGTRMRSSRPKPLHRLCGRPMVLHVLHAVAGLADHGYSIDRVVVVVGHGAERVQKAVIDQAPPGLHLEFVEQPEQRGTGDAVAVAMTAFAGDDDEALTDDEEADVLVLAGDTPLLRSVTLAGLIDAHRYEATSATVMTAIVEDATGYGRVIRGKDDRVLRIVEHKDATDEERHGREINTSIFAFRRSLLAPALRRIEPNNSQGEYYLTDIVEVLSSAGHRVGGVEMEDVTEAMGVNDRIQLALAEAELRRRVNDEWMRRGVTMVDPAQTYVDTTVVLGRDITLYPGTVLQGATVVGDGAEIGPDARLVDCQVGTGACVEQTVAHRATLGAGCRVGPYAVLEPGSIVAPDTSTGPHSHIM